MRCQCRLLSCNKCTTLVGDFDWGEGGSYASVGAGGIWKISVLLALFCCESKTALQNKVYFLKRRILDPSPLPQKGGVHDIRFYKEGSFRKSSHTS